MYHRVRRKMDLKIYALILVIYIASSIATPLDMKEGYNIDVDGIDNDIVDLDDEYSLKYNKKLETNSRNTDFDKDSYKYSIVKEDKEENTKTRKENSFTNENNTNTKNNLKISNQNTEKTTEINLMPIELLSTTDINPVGDLDGTTNDLTVIPLSTEKYIPAITIKQTVTLPGSTEMSEDFNLTTGFFELTTKAYNSDKDSDVSNGNATDKSVTVTNNITEMTTTEHNRSAKIETSTLPNATFDEDNNSSVTVETLNISDVDTTDSSEEVPIFTELDTEESSHIPDDYYDTKDIVPTTAPKTDALSVLIGFAGSVVESVVENVAERVFPKGLYDLIKRMQKQNEAIEAEKLRSREENGGLGQFTRGVIKTLSTELSKPFSQLMAGARDNGSLDIDHGFVNNLASGVTSVANSMVDVFKDRVQAIYPGTVWCGDGHAPQARSGELGLFFFTDTCCRQHDACKMYIKAGETRFGLTNTGLFTRSHCSCDSRFRKCLQKTNSLVSGQIGLTYFNVLGPQCFRRAHPIIRCIRRTRITNLKCEEYELDLTKPKMWQWFDNETF